MHGYKLTTPIAMPFISDIDIPVYMAIENTLLTAKVSYEKKPSKFKGIKYTSEIDKLLSDKEKQEILVFTEDVFRNLFVFMKQWPIYIELGVASWVGNKNSIKDAILAILLYTIHLSTKKMFEKSAILRQLLGCNISNINIPAITTIFLGGIHQVTVLEDHILPTRWPFPSGWNYISLEYNSTNILASHLTQIGVSLQKFDFNTIALLGNSNTSPEHVYKIIQKSALLKAHIIGPFGAINNIVYISTQHNAKEQFLNALHACNSILYKISSGIKLH